MEEIQENMCRLCLQITAEMESIFNFKENYVQTVEEFTGIKITNIFGFPLHICRNCVSTIRLLRNFKETCLKSEEWLQKNHFKQEISQSDETNNYKNFNNDDEKEIDFTEYEKKYNPLNGNVAIAFDIATQESDDRLHDDSDDGLDEDETLFEIREKLRKAANQMKKENTIKKKRGPYKKRTAGDKDKNSKRNQTNKKERNKRKYVANKKPCHMCGKFYTSYAMRAHMNVHNGVRPFLCTSAGCDKSFASVIAQKRHYRICHTDHAPHECDVCGKKFKIRPKLTLHRSYHFEPKLPCKICGKLFKNTRALRKHSIIHTGERPFKCETCEKCFQTRFTWRIHQRVHTKEKPYECTKCDKSFAYNCLLKAHTEKYHNSDKS